MRSFACAFVVADASILLKWWGPVAVLARAIVLLWCGIRDQKDIISLLSFVALDVLF